MALDTHFPADRQSIDQYRNALDEWAEGFPQTVKLESEDYSQVYDAILDAMKSVESNEIDGPLLSQRLSAWAGFGAYVPLNAQRPSN